MNFSDQSQKSGNFFQKLGFGSQSITKSKRSCLSTIKTKLSIDISLQRVFHFQSFHKLIMINISYSISSFDGSITLTRFADNMDFDWILN